MVAWNAFFPHTTHMAFFFLYDALEDLVGSRYITDGTGRRGMGPHRILM